MFWNRAEQKYFILRRDNPWSVLDMSWRRIADFPTYCYDKELTNAICFAKTDEEVMQLLENRDISNEQREVYC